MMMTRSIQDWTPNILQTLLDALTAHDIDLGNLTQIPTGEYRLTVDSGTIALGDEPMDDGTDTQWRMATMREAGDNGEVYEVYNGPSLNDLADVLARYTR